MAEKYTITLGGWYQRTTLHLSEIYGFLSSGFSKLNLSKDKLHEYHQNLKLQKVSREVGYLEYVKAVNDDDIEIRYYEDGLYVLECSSDDIFSAQDNLKNYLDKYFNPAVAYIFSLGAPTPKVLADIKTVHPVVVGLIKENPEEFQVDAKKYGEVYSKITSDEITVFKTSLFIFVVASPKQKKAMTEIIETQIFFREFKDQLEKYLSIHRTIWEEISAIREKRFIKGNDIENQRIKLENYQKTINLIGSRINQMGAYIHTRASIAKDLQIESQLITLFQYKFEILTDTNTYIQEIWNMTKEYLNTALEIIRDLENKKVNNSIRSIQILASVGVISGLFGYLTKDSFPNITTTGLIYFAILVFASWPLNYLVTLIYKNIKYKINFPEYQSKI